MNIQNFFKYFISLILFLIIFSSICLYSKNQNNYNSNISDDNNLFFPSDNLNAFFWPVPGYNKITSYFGKRTSPTTGASTNHSGIDIASPEHTSIYSVLPGVVSYVGFKGAGGFTITISSSSFQVSYSHVSPNFLVYKGKTVYQKEKIAEVGPKYVDNVLNNPYKDSTGKSTNGATTGPHLHLTIKKDGIAVNPLDYF